MIDPADALRQKVARALEEDLGAGDVTSEATVPEDARARARIVQKEPGVVYGLEVVAETMRQCGVEDVDNLVVEGQWREHVPAEILLASGSARSLLAAERTALNFLGHLSGVATLTHRYAEAVAGTGATILDTRKTTPSMRWLEKGAVAVAGGINHRMGLFDAILIKENHIAAAGGVGEALRNAFALNAGVEVQVEVETLEQLREALEAGAKSVLLDNFTEPLMREAVAVNQGRALLEVSGNVQLGQMREIAATGVDRISIGRLTKDVKAVDYSMRVLERI